MLDALSSRPTPSPISAEISAELGNEQICFVPDRDDFKLGGIDHRRIFTLIRQLSKGDSLLFDAYKSMYFFTMARHSIGTMALPITQQDRAKNFSDIAMLDKIGIRGTDVSTYFHKVCRGSVSTAVLALLCLRCAPSDEAAKNLLTRLKFKVQKAEAYSDEEVAGMRDFFDKRRPELTVPAILDEAEHFFQLHLRHRTWSASSVTRGLQGIKAIS